MTTTILFITAAPDQRASTSNLGQLVEETNVRPGCRAELWYLRCAPEHSPLPGTRTVDRLRTWIPARIVEGTGLHRVAAGLRGTMLRSWLRRLRPAVVVLDDGLGRRVVEGLVDPAAIVVRVNAFPPEHAHMEPPAEQHPDMWIVPAGAERPPNDRPCSVEYEFRESPATQYVKDPHLRERVRRSLDLPETGPLIVGWGGDGWLDGPDLFVRALWALRKRHDVDAHGVWFDLGTDDQEAERLRAEATRCGVADHFHLRQSADPTVHMCGDAVLLPYRSDAEVNSVLDAAFSGAITVVFDAAAVSHPLVTSVRDLDVDAAAAAIATGLEDRVAKAEFARRCFSPGPIVDDLLDLARQR